MNVFEIDDIELIKKLIRELANRNEIKALRKLIRNNKRCTRLNPKELNKEIHVDKYKFSSRGGNLILIVDKKDSVNDKCMNVLDNAVIEMK